MNDIGSRRPGLELIQGGKEVKAVDFKEKKEKMDFIFERMDFFQKVLKLVENSKEINKNHRENISQEIQKSLEDVEDSFGQYVDAFFVVDSLYIIKCSLINLFDENDIYLKLHSIKEKDSEKTKIIKIIKENIEKILDNYLDSWRISRKEYEKYNKN